MIYIIDYSWTTFSWKQEGFFISKKNIEYNYFTKLLSIFLKFLVCYLWNKRLVSDIYPADKYLLKASSNKGTRRMSVGLAVQDFIGSENVSFYGVVFIGCGFLKLVCFWKS